MKFGSPIWRTYNELPRGAYEWALDYQEDNDNKSALRQPSFTNLRLAGLNGLLRETPVFAR